MSEELVAKLATIATRSTAHMETDERAACIGTMLSDLEQLATLDGCIAAAWSIEILPALVELLERIDKRAVRMREALAGLVGASTLKELGPIEAIIRAAPIPERDKVGMLNAIHALQDTA